jgi:hypothetical protein
MRPSTYGNYSSACASADCGDEGEASLDFAQLVSMLAAQSQRFRISLKRCRTHRFELQPLRLPALERMSIPSHSELEEAYVGRLSL